ncbi:DELTA-alicitoxin-Pse2b-like [Oculina patagonica]
MPSALPTCTKEAKEDISTRGFQFYKDTEEFYSTLTTTSGLEGSLKTDFSLGLTLDLASRNVGGTNRTVTGNSLLFVASYRQDMLEKKCLTDDKHFDKEFLESLKTLPVTIREPWNSNAWKHYDVFLNKYGSHINQMAFAETEDFYTERDFQVKSCISLGVPLDALFGGCSGIDKSEILRVSKMSMRGELVIKGGTTETRNELINKNRTADLIEKFMNEANATNAAIQYSFTSIWDILQSLYVGKNNNNFVRAVNLEFYYLGFLNYGCYYKTGGGQDLQMFNFTQSSTPTSPQYECTLAPDGCHGSSDCWHRSFHPCACRGPSCVRYDYLLLDTLKTKKIARINWDHNWAGPGCSGKLKCHCKHESKQRVPVWPEKRNSKDVLYKAHHLNLNRLKPERKEA